MGNTDPWAPLGQVGALLACFIRFTRGFPCFRPSPAYGIIAPASQRTPFLLASMTPTSRVFGWALAVGGWHRCIPFDTTCRVCFMYCCPKLRAATLLRRQLLLQRLPRLRHQLPVLGRQRLGPLPLEPLQVAPQEAAPRRRLVLAHVQEHQV